MSTETNRTLTSANIPPERHVKVLGGQGWVGLVDVLGTETTLVNAARVSFGKRVSSLTERDVTLLRYLLEHRHTSPLEHMVFTFIVHCPLFVRSQWHRHRTWSYNEISRRYTEVDIEFYVPPHVRAQSADNRQASVDTLSAEKQEEARAAMHAAHRHALEIYQRLLALGVCREQARGVLPQNLMTTFWATVDLNNLLHFLELRDHEGAQWEIRQYAQAIKQLVRPLIPHVAEIVGW
ncbi:MAG: FAD-dependent thymidylate synthase [bacterium]|nr:FAD-dependent thymidylate synthase [bacterium]